MSLAPKFNLPLSLSIALTLLLGSFPALPTVKESRRHSSVKLLLLLCARYPSNSACVCVYVRVRVRE